jgi:hypothetical protein
MVQAFFSESWGGALPSLHLPDARETQLSIT